MRLQLLDRPTLDAYRIMRQEFRIVKTNPDIIYTQLTPVTCSVPVFTPCTGTDHVKSPKIINLYDKDWLEWNVYGTAEHTMALILAKMKNIDYHSLLGESVRTSTTPMSLDLHGRRLLVVGYGRVGKQVCRMAHAFGMNVETVVEGDPMDLIKSKLTRADVISFHIPLTKENEGLVDEKWFGAMKKGALVVNTSRAAIFDETAMYRRRNTLMFALDTTETYSDGVVEGLIDCGAIVTPHVAGYSDKSREATDMWIVERMLDWKLRYEGHFTMESV